MGTCDGDRDLVVRACLPARPTDLAGLGATCFRKGEEYGFHFVFAYILHAARQGGRQGYCHSYALSLLVLVMKPGTAAASNLSSNPAAAAVTHLRPPWSE
eukprot:GHVU01131399.1.p1 GENE.GHVU01131399.1~~GHVU01131399.1.p1  ORF type:complete len:100 (+),score=4.47 GHVU01131399.1:170-469(+)